MQVTEAERVAKEHLAIAREEAIAARDTSIRLAAEMQKLKL